MNPLSCEDSSVSEQAHSRIPGCGIGVPMERDLRALCSETVDPDRGADKNESLQGCSEYIILSRFCGAVETSILWTVICCFFCPHCSARRSPGWPRLPWWTAARWELPVHCVHVPFCCRVCRIRLLYSFCVFIAQTGGFPLSFCSVTVAGEGSA